MTFSSMGQEGKVCFECSSGWGSLFVSLERRGKWLVTLTPSGDNCTEHFLSLGLLWGAGGEQSWSTVLGLQFLRHLQESSQPYHWRHVSTLWRVNSCVSLMQSFEFPGKAIKFRQEKWWEDARRGNQNDKEQEEDMFLMLYDRNPKLTSFRSL